MSFKKSGRTGSRLVNKSLCANVEDTTTLTSRSSRLVLHGGQPLPPTSQLKPLRGPVPRSSTLQPLAPSLQSGGVFFDDPEDGESRSFHKMAALQAPSTEAPDVVAAYWYALVTIRTAFGVDPYLWVLQDWDTKAKTLAIGSYRHVVVLPCSTYDFGIACTCPKWKAAMSCLHQDVFRAHTGELQALSQVAPSPTGAAVLLHATPFKDK
ncbi:hypothetical protein BDN67DRAFT_748695 [Paxillus ammoniavirescens]|nr:hypothetical protein BDN67DRAFT_748695 [Paxillus ammoniavirescens]